MIAPDGPPKTSAIMRLPGFIMCMALKELSYKNKPISKEILLLFIAKRYIMNGELCIYTGVMAMVAAGAHLRFSEVC